MGKLVLPLLGGSPEVWNTCVLFFQAMLLAGYAWAHAGPRLGGERRHVLIHSLALLASLSLLPIGRGIASTPPDPGHPVGWLLGTLLASIGVPFFLLAATGPLVQQWFSRGAHPRAADPYFLYAASNAGSLIGLLAYPVLIEPLLPLDAQAAVWSAGYGVVALLAIACGSLAWRRLGPAPDGGAPGTEGALPAAAPDRWRERLRWVVLAAAPSSLLLGLTTYVTTDIAAVPLLWVLPLAVYLLTFILAFTQPPVIPYAWVARWQPLLAVPLLIVLFWGSYLEAPGLLPFHLLVFFATALACHGALAASRPQPFRLTEFYLVIGVGGAIGGAFNVLAAPVLFSSVAEYPLVLAAATALGLPRVSEKRNRGGVRIAILAAVVLMGARLLVLPYEDRPALLSPIVVASACIASALAGVAAYRIRDRRVAFGFSLVLFLMGGLAAERASHTVLLQERDFFGVRRVLLVADARAHLLFNGGTKHGAQSTDPALRREPMSYYSRSGPLGDVFRELPDRAGRRVGVVGLGTGAMAAYARPGEEWVYFELDPRVERIARDPRYFTYLADSPVPARIVLGDGRLSLTCESDGRFDLLILDAFSSDAIPVHLLTREAIALYLRKLGPGGVLVLHLSNRYLDLVPIVTSLSRDAGVAMRVRFGPDHPGPLADPAMWAVLARRPEDLGGIARDARWNTPRAAQGRAWTDGYSNVVSALRVLQR